MINIWRAEGELDIISASLNKKFYVHETSQINVLSGLIDL